MKTKNLKPKVKTPEQTPEPVNRPGAKAWFWWILFATIGIFAAINWDDYVVEKDGKLELAPKRKEKLERELEQIDNAVQYALIVDIAGYFPCLNCDGRSTIFLNVDETWKFGTTRVGEKERYKSNPFDQRLSFEGQFFGNYAECLKVEKTKIYTYILLPENQKREIPLVRPPGNPYDN